MVVFWKDDNGSRAGRDHANARLDEPEMVGYLPLPPSDTLGGHRIP
jgi:hypothetical protein